MTSLTRLQSRGMITIPQDLRNKLQLEDGQVIVLTEQSHGQWLCQAIWPAFRFFALFDAEASHIPAPGPFLASPRWLAVTTIAQAQQDPQSAARAWCEPLSRGLTSIQADPVLLPDLLSAVGQWFPEWPREGLAFYVQTLLAWPGIMWPDRPRYLTALALWARDHTCTWSQAVMSSHQEELDDTLPLAKETPADE